MKILIHATHYPVASARYVAVALEQAGHDVRTDGPSTGAVLPWHGGLTVDERHAWIPNKPERGWKPDLVLHMDSWLQPKAARGALHVVYGVDNHVRDYRFAEPGEAPYPFDRLFLAHSNGFRMGEDNVTWLPCGYDPFWFQPGPAWSERPYDAAMVGVMYGARSELLYALLNAIPHIRMAYGLGVYEQYASAYRSARLSLVRSARDDVAQRVWETAAMGSLVIMDRVHDAVHVGLVDGDNCLMYDTTDEAVERARWALTHPTDAEVIAQAGQAWAQAGTWAARAQVIVNWAEQQLGAVAQKALASDDD